MVKHLTANPDHNGAFQTTLGIMDFTRCEIQVHLASLANVNQEVPLFEKLQMTTHVADRFRRIVGRTIKLLSKDHSSGDLRLLEYDAAAMNRQNECEYISLSNRSDLTSQFCDFSSLSSLSLFTGEKVFVDGLKFYVITVSFSGQRPIYFFRTYSPKNELSRSSHFGIRLSKTTFDEVKESVFLFDEHIDCFSTDGYLFILSKDKFQKIFRYFERLMEAGRAALQVISSKIKIENFDALSKFCEGHLQKMAKLKNIAAKPYLKDVTMEDVKRVIKEFNLKVKMVSVNGEDRLLFDPKDKDKWMILRILDDDYLGSIMTDLKYEANSKRTVS